MNVVVPEMLLQSGLDVACSSISAGEANAGIDRYFTVVTLGERKSVCGSGGREVGGEKIIKRLFSRHNFSRKAKDANAKDAFKWLHRTFWILRRSSALPALLHILSSPAFRSLAARPQEQSLPPKVERGEFHSQPTRGEVDASGLNIKSSLLFHSTTSNQNEGTSQAACRRSLQRVKSPA